ncbi:lytic transglycosylase domain-containing protein [Edwardsiella piscicida]|nr:lytic transglycosylase domain-containing protein [Edwardsiella piscicida]WCF12659.1 lytic transglycosylase domain-containing protein [Edwardsiella piscicida]
MRKWVLLGLALLAWRCVGAPLKWYRVSGEERVASTLAPPPVISRGAGYASLIGQVAGKHALDPRLIQAVVAVESSYRYDTVSEKGAIGLMQVMPETAARFGHFALLDPRDNLEVGTRYLSTLLRRFNGRLDLALAGYNAGEGAVLRYGGRFLPILKRSAMCSGCWNTIVSYDRRYRRRRCRRRKWWCIRPEESVTLVSYGAC